MLLNTTQLIDIAIRAALLAGREINKIYLLDDFETLQKDDKTPVTLADRLAHNVILQELECTELPVLSEEGIHLSYAERKNWDLFWLVDPLDGTKEFIKRNDEFTVNIALIQNKQTVAGVVYAPVSGELYVGISGIGSYKVFFPEMNITFQTILNTGEKLPLEKNQDAFIVAISRSHMNRETEEYIENLRKENKSVSIVSKGSSLKICMVAEGTANVYPKLGKTMEWDTAAGHAILLASGKNIFYPDLITQLIYNKEDLQNPYFIAK